MLSQSRDSLSTNGGLVTVIFTSLSQFPKEIISKILGSIPVGLLHCHVFSQEDVYLTFRETQ